MKTLKIEAIGDFGLREFSRIKNFLKQEHQKIIGAKKDHSCEKVNQDDVNLGWFQNIVEIKARRAALSSRYWTAFAAKQLQAPNSV